MDRSTGVRKVPPGGSMAGYRMLRIGCAGDADESVLRLFATSIYDVSFHDAHREPAEAWIQRLKQPGGEPTQHASLLLGAQPGPDGVPEVLAGALSETYRGGVVLLTYIVVRPDLKGRGYGSCMMREVREKHAGSVLLAEMADPALSAAEDLADALRRAQVFSAWGWRAVRFPYHQPPLESGGGWASDLLLLHHGDAACVSGSSIDALNAGLQESLGAGRPPAYLTHRFSAGPGRPSAVETLAIVDVIV